MVYGRILYNSIREYTPKFFPTVPYSQTVKPLFGNILLNQESNLRSSPSGIPNPLSSEAGEFSASSLTTAGVTNFSCLAFVSAFGPPSTSPASGSTSTITEDVPSKLPWSNNEPIRKSLESRRWPRKRLREQQNRQQLQPVEMTSDKK